MPTLGRLKLGLRRSNRKLLLQILQISPPPPNRHKFQSQAVHLLESTQQKPHQSHGETQRPSRGSPSNSSPPPLPTGRHRSRSRERGGREEGEWGEERQKRSATGRETLIKKGRGRIVRSKTTIHPKNPNHFHHLVTAFHKTLPCRPTSEP